MSSPATVSAGISARSPAFVASCWAIASVSFAPAVHANFLPAISRDFGLSLAQGSLYLSLNFLGALFSVMVAGLVAGRVGSRRVLVAAWLLELAAVAAIGLAPRPVVAYVGVVLASTSFGAISVLVPHLVSGIAGERRNRALSLVISFYTLGAVASNLLVLLFFALGASWRVGYLAASAMGLPWGLLLLRSGTGAPDGAPGSVRAARAEVGAAARAGRVSAGAVVFVALCLAQLAGGAAEVSTSLWVPTFLSREIGAPESLGPAALLLFCVMGAVGKLVNAAAADRVDRRLPVCLGIALFGVGLTVATLSASVLTALAGFGLVGLGTGGFVPAVTVAMAERFPRSAASRYSIFMTAGNLGPVGGPVLVAMVAGGDLRRGLLAMLPAAALCAAVLLAVRRGERGPMEPSRIR
jgi:MFS family permease